MGNYRAGFASGVAVALACLMPASAMAAIVGETTLFSALCSERAAIGFTWTAGHWVPSKLNLGRFRVEKLPPDRADCVFVIAREPPGFEADTFSIANGCYSLGSANKQASTRPSVESCGEVWLIKDGVHTLLHVVCRLARQDITFDPEGNFNLSSVPGDLSDKPEKGEKDPLYVSYGACELK